MNKIRSSEISLKGFTPTGIDYSSVDAKCHICQNYAEIDWFAKACALDKIWALKSSGSSTFTSVPLTKEKTFSAAGILEALDGVDLESTKNTSWSGSIKKALGISSTFKVLFINLMTYQKEPGKNLRTSKQILAAIAEDLWLGFLKARGDVLGAFGQTAVNNAYHDHIAKARLVFSWLRYSISYDYKMLEDAAKVQSLRDVAEALAKGTEICGGYSDLFKTMYNAMSESGGDERGLSAKEFKAFARSRYGGKESKSIGSSDAGHAWNCYPLKAAPSAWEYQIVDCTWAASARTEEEARLWWSRSNAAFLATHVPTSEFETCMQSVPGGFSQTGLWNKPRPKISPELEEETYWIDVGSLTPSTLTAKVVNSQSMTVSFKNNCTHQRAQMPDFFLGKSQQNANIAWDKFKDAPNNRPFAKFDLNHTTGAWSAKLNLLEMDACNGCLCILAPFGSDGKRVKSVPGLQGQFTFRPVITWQLVV